MRAIAGGRGRRSSGPAEAVHGDVVGVVGVVGHDVAEVEHNGLSHAVRNCLVVGGRVLWPLGCDDE